MIIIKKYLLVLLFWGFVTVITGSLTAQDVFFDLESSVSNVRSNLSSMCEVSRGTQAFDRYQDRLKLMQQQASAVQKRLDAFDIGDDLEFERNATLLLDQFKYDSFAKKDRKNSLLQKNGLTADQILTVMERDIDTLKEKRFSMNPDTTPFTKNIMILKDLFRFQRLIKDFDVIRNKSSELSENASLRMYYEKRLVKLEDAAKKADALLLKYFPEKLGDLRFADEIPILRNYFHVSVRSKLDKSTRLERSAHNKQFNISLQKDTIRSDAEAALTRIKKVLHAFDKVMKPVDREMETAVPQKQEEIISEDTLKEKFPELNKKVDEQGKASENTVNSESTDAADKNKRTYSEPPLERLDDAAVSEKLNTLRDSAFPSDDAKTVSGDQLSRCLCTLSQKQRGKYESILAKKKRNGEKEAELSALRELKPLLASPNLAPKKKEMIDILRKNEKESQE